MNSFIATFRNESKPNCLWNSDPVCIRDIAAPATAAKCSGSTWAFQSEMTPQHTSLDDRSGMCGVCFVNPDSASVAHCHVGHYKPTMSRGPAHVQLAKDPIHLWRGFPSRRTVESRFGLFPKTRNISVVKTCRGFEWATISAKPSQRSSIRNLGPRATRSPNKAIHLSL